MQHPTAFPIAQRGALDRHLAFECAVELKYFITTGFRQTAELPDVALRVGRVHFFALGVEARLGLRLDFELFQLLVLHFLENHFLLLLVVGQHLLQVFVVQVVGTLAAGPIAAGAEDAALLLVEVGRVGRFGHVFGRSQRLNRQKAWVS